MSIPLPSSSIRDSLPSLIRPLRRVRPHLPFFRLAIHRIPTLWGLYRGLLKTVPIDCIHIKDTIRDEFRRNKRHVGTGRTIFYLQKGYKLLDTFSLAAQGNSHARRVIERYNRFLGLRIERRKWEKAIDAQIKEQTRPRSILTGTLMWPTPFNSPLPRLKPQPEHITMMIKNRIRIKEKRFERTQQLIEYRQLLLEEAAFENSLLGTSDIPGRLFPTPASLAAAIAPINQEFRSIMTRVKASLARRNTPIPQGLLDQLKEARREKVRNKTRERLREERGEILRSTMRRMRTGPPAHVLCKMSPKQLEEDKVIRGASQVGYVGMIKQKKGMNLRTGRHGVEGRRERVEMEKLGKKWSVIDGQWFSEEEEQRIRDDWEMIEQENARRRTAEG